MILNERMKRLLFVGAICALGACDNATTEGTGPITPGPTGTTGPTGPTGPTGTTAPTGTTGPTAPTMLSCANLPAPTILATGQFVTDLKVDATNAYWADQTGAISKVPTAGGTATVLGTLSAAYNGGPVLALDANNVYIAGGSGVASVPKTGGAMNILVVGENPTGALALEGQRLYWGEAWTSTAANSAVIHSMSIDGGPVSDLAANLAELGATSVAVDSANLYFTNLGEGTVNQVLLAGGPVVMLANDQEGLNGIAVGDSHVYWANFAGPIGAPEGQPPPTPTATDGTVDRVPIGGGATQTLATSYTMNAVAVDATHFYFSTVDDASGDLVIESAPIDGGTPTVLACAGAWIGPVVDDTAIYWVNVSDTSFESVMRLPKPTP